MRIIPIVAMLIFAGITNMSGPAFVSATNVPQAPEPQAKSAPRNLAILIFDGVQIIDYTGPFETFGHVPLDGNHAFNIYTVSEKPQAITTSMGMSVNPKYTLDNAPEPNILVIPGGDVRGQENNPAVLKFIQDKAKNAEIVMSVCNGAYILAKTGLLDGLEATTTANLIPGLKLAAPKTKVVDDKRFVDNGKIITTAGLSSGIDGALHVIDRLFGRGVAQSAALGMEYNWDPESTFARAALADKYLLFNYDVKVRAGGWRALSREGSRDRWENKWSVTTDSSASEVLNSVNKSIADEKTYAPSGRGKWSRLDDASQKSTNQSLWRFTDERGAAWSGVVSIAPVSGEQNRFTLSVKVARNDSSAQLPAK
jgi:putative intracellular protease/amidase